MHSKSIIFLICFLNFTTQTIAGRTSRFFHLPLSCFKGGSTMRIMHTKSIIFLIYFLNFTMQTIAVKKSKYLSLPNLSGCFTGRNTKGDVDRTAYTPEKKSSEIKYSANKIDKPNPRSIQLSYPKIPNEDPKEIASLKTAEDFKNYADLKASFSKVNISGARRKVNITCTYKTATDVNEQYMNTADLSTDSTPKKDSEKLDQGISNTDLIDLNNDDFISDGNTNKGTSVLDVMVKTDKMSDLAPAVVPREPLPDNWIEQTVTTKRYNPFEYDDGEPNSKVVQQDNWIEQTITTKRYNPFDYDDGEPNSQAATIPYQLQPQSNMNPMPKL